MYVNNVGDSRAILVSNNLKGTVYVSEEVYIRI
jgi:serine/threonine protein phosphatase PrpC